MSLITIKATITPDDFHRYVDKLDETELPYSFVCTSAKSANPVVLELWLDGASHNGTEVRLNKDGTWTAMTDIVIGSEV